MEINEQTEITGKLENSGRGRFGCACENIQTKCLRHPASYEGSGEPLNKKALNKIAMRGVDIISVNGSGDDLNLGRLNKSLGSDSYGSYLEVGDQSQERSYSDVEVSLENLVEMYDANLPEKVVLDINDDLSRFDNLDNEEVSLSDNLAHTIDGWQGARLSNDLPPDNWVENMNENELLESHRLSGECTNDVAFLFSIEQPLEISVGSMAGEIRGFDVYSEQTSKCNSAADQNDISITDEIFPNRILNESASENVISSISSGAVDEDGNRAIGNGFSFGTGFGRAEDEGLPKLDDDKEFSAVEINDLPEPILIHIFKLFSTRELVLRISPVCLAWRILAYDAALWRRILLGDCPKLTDSDLLRLSGLSSAVHRLELSDSRLVTDEGVCAALAHCSNLRRLSLSCPQQKNAVATIARCCPRLEQLVMCGSSHFTVSGLRALAVDCSSIRSLDFSMCRMTKTQLRVLAEFKQLRELSLAYVYNVDDTIVALIVDNCLLLHSLDLSVCPNFTGDIVNYLVQKALNLTCLRLSGCRLMDQALFSVATHCKALRALDVSFNDYVTLSGATNVCVSCPKLTHLCLLHCDISFDNLLYLKENFPGITFKLSK